MISRKLETALRNLARTARGPFKVYAYTTTSTGEAQATLQHELKRLVQKAASDTASKNASIIVVDPSEPVGSAASRRLFQEAILDPVDAAYDPKKTKKRLKPDVIRGKGTSDQARDRLSDLSASLPDLLADVERTISGMDNDSPKRTGESMINLDPTENKRDSDLSPDPSKPETGKGTPEPTSISDDDPDSSERVPLVVVRRLEDLGAHAGAIAQTLERIILRGGHVAAPADILDTCTRDGKLAGRLLLRVGGLQTTDARTRANARLDRRRKDLKVYGPVPFGFRKKGDALVPNDRELSTVRRIQDLTRIEQPPVAIAATLNRENRSWKDETPWTWRRVRGIQKNTIYDHVITQRERA